MESEGRRRSGTGDTMTLTPFELTGYASTWKGGKRPNLHPDRHLFPTKGKTVAERMSNYVKLCKRDGKVLTQVTIPGRYAVEWEEPQEHTRWITEIRGGEVYGHHATNKSRRRRTWRYEPGTVTLTNCTSRATFVLTDADKTEQLATDTAQALEFWAQVGAQVSKGTSITIGRETP